MHHYISLVAQALGLANYIRNEMDKYDEGRKEVIANVEKIIQLLKDVCQKYGTKEEDLPSNLRGILKNLRTELDGIKNKLNQGGVSQVKTILWGGDLMNTVSDCKRKLSDVLQTGQFALSLDGRFAQDAEQRRVRTFPILNRLMLPLMQFENPKARHGGPPQPRAAGRSQIEQQLRPTPPQGDRSYPDYTNSDSMLRTGPSQRSQPYPPSSDGNLYRQTPVDVTGMNQIQQQPRQHQSSELGHRNGYPPYSTINVPGTSLARQQSPLAGPWVGARQQRSHYVNPAVPIAAVGGGTTSRRVFPTAGPTGPALTLVNMVVVPDRAMAAGAPTNWSPN